MLLALVDGRLQHFALRREPKAIVNQLRIARHQLVLQMPGAAIKSDLFNAPMGRQQDCTARRFIDPARLHADIPVLYKIKPPDAVLTAIIIELCQ